MNSAGALLPKRLHNKRAQWISVQQKTSHNCGQVENARQPDDHARRLGSKIDRSTMPQYQAQRQRNALIGRCDPGFKLPLNKHDDLRSGAPIHGNTTLAARWINTTIESDQPVDVRRASCGHGLEASLRESV